MKLATEVARELFLYGPAGGRRVTAVAELVLGKMRRGEMPPSVTLDEMKAK
jgi:hypothetical protein